MIARLAAFVLALLRSRAVWVLAGLAALSVMLWVVGPVVSVGEWMPLASVRSRVIVIALLLGVFALLRLAAYWRTHALNRRLLDTLAGARDLRAGHAAATSNTETHVLKRRFEEAMAVLRRARHGEADGIAGFFRRRQYVYELPWYLVIGAPGAGKTTVLANSGLEFPLAGSLGKGAVKGVGGTRHCDWWFTDQAVIIDTAGRYTTHESEVDADREEWSGFLGLLRKYRPRQPINGVVVAIPVSDLLTADRVALRRTGTLLRSRLDELRAAVGIDVPVYCVVTKCDLLAGFAEFFGGLDRAGRSQVWGFTLPADLSTGQDELRARVAGELALLQQRLHDGLVPVLQRESDVVRRALCYGMPQQFEGLCGVLPDLFEAMALASRYSAGLQLRGLYFTSATQEGTPFDRVLSGLDRSFQSGIARQARQPGSGQGYFIHDLLGKLVFAESHLAGANQRQGARLRLMRVAGYAVSVALTVAAVLAWSVSYRNNLGYLAAVDVNAAVLEKNVAALAGMPVAPLTVVLPLLDRLDRAADGSDFRYSDPLLPWRFGLYQGDKLHAGADIAYQRLLRRTFAPAVHARLEELLRGMQVDDLDFAFEALRAYLMLHDREHHDAAEFRAFMLADWDRNMPQGAGAPERQGYARQLDLLAEVRPDELPPPDAALVQDARARLTQYSLSQRVYGRLRRRLGENLLPPFSVAGAAGERAASVFRRASGKALTDGVPSLYTWRGYHELFLPELDSTFALLGRDESWVLGVDAKPATRILQDRMSGELALEVRRLYMRDYVVQWERFLDDVKLVRPDSLADSIQLARTLGAPDSPMALFVKAAARETRLSKEAPQANGSGSLFDQVKNSVRSTRDDLGRIVGPSAMPGSIQPRERPELIVDARFESLQRLAGGAGGAGQAPVDAVVQSMNELYSVLAATEAARQAGNRPPGTDLPQRLKADAGRLPQPLRRIVEDLAQAGQVQIAREDRVVRSGELVGNVSALCEQTITGRYPFVRGAPREVMPEDFARMFGPSGKFEEYFRANLADLVNVTTRPWTLRRGAQGDMGGGGGVAAFEKARTIREVFFRTGDGIPKISLTLKPVEMDASITTFAMDVDGQVIRYQHGPQVAQTVTWPGPRGSQQVRVMLEPAQPGARAGVTTEGPWALHRLFDEAQIVRGDSPERFTVMLDIGGRTVTLEATASSVHNPFRLQEMSGFRCPVAL